MENYLRGVFRININEIEVEKQFEKCEGVEEKDNKDKDAYINGVWKISKKLQQFVEQKNG